MKKRRPLTLHRETLRLLDERNLRKTPAGFVPVQNDTDQVECFSPLCGPTAWRTCETN